MRPDPSLAELILRPADLDDPGVAALLIRHGVTARAATARGSAHALDLDPLRAPGIEVWSAWDDGALVGVGGLKQISPDHGELKAMYAAETARRQGVGSAVLCHLIGLARARGMRRLSLETGAGPYFDPARALYRRHGFGEAPPFGDYRPDPNSGFMTLDLSSVE